MGARVTERSGEQLVYFDHFVPHTRHPVSLLERPPARPPLGRAVVLDCLRTLSSLSGGGL
jgi:hypothetical protein